MCCQDGDPAIWQMLHEPAGWSPQAEDDFSPHEQPGAEELPTAAAVLIIKLAAIQDGELVAIQDAEAVKGTVPPGHSGSWQVLHEPAGWSPEAEDDFSPYEQPGAEELPTAAAELIIRLVATPRTGRPLRARTSPASQEA